MQTNINNFNDLKTEIKRLFLDNKLEEKDYKECYDSILSIVNEIENKYEYFLDNIDKFNSFLLENHKSTLGYWATYLSGARAKLITVNFINEKNEVLKESDVAKIYRYRAPEQEKNIFIVFKLNEERVKELIS